MESESTHSFTPPEYGPADASAATESQGFRTLVRLLTDYNGFLDDYIAKGKTPWFYFLLWIAGVAGVIDRMENAALFGGDYLISSWPVAWVSALVLAVGIGPLGYIILGGFFHLRVLMCNGFPRGKVSSAIWLYSSWPVFVWTIVVTIANTIAYGDAYFIGEADFSLEAITVVTALPCLAYSMFLSYRAAVRVQECNKIGASLLFIALPTAFYVLLFGAIALRSFSSTSSATDLNEDGLNYYHAGDFERAESAFKEAVGNMGYCDPEDRRSILVNLAYVQEARGDTSSATDCLRRALEIAESGSPDCYSLQGEIALLEHRVTDAAGLFEQALQGDSANFQVHNNLSLIYLGEFDEAHEDYEAALPHSVKAYQLSGDIYCRQNLAINLFFVDEYESALNHLQSLDSDYPEDALTKFYLGMTEYQLEDLEAARLHLSQAVALDSTYYLDFVAGFLAGQEPQSE